VSVTDHSKKWKGLKIENKVIPNTIGRLLHKLAFVLPGGFSLKPRLHRIRSFRIGKGVWINQLVFIEKAYLGSAMILDNSYFPRDYRNLRQGVE
jgi:hypothetical protein